jgi:formate dehydrogenase maturation protein FdhE
LIDRTQNPNTANDGIAKSLAERPSVTPLCGSTPLASVMR